MDLQTVLRRVALHLENGQLDEADALLTAAVPDHADQRELLVTHAHCKQKNGDAAAALFLWEKVRARFPDHSYAHAAAASLLLARKDFGAAEAAIVPALMLFPADADVLANATQIAITRGDWTTALERLNVLRVRLPDHPFTVKFANAMEEQIAAGYAGAASRPGGDPPDVVDKDKLKQLLLSFESLGDNCELGLVQRHFGFEPLGLFRFTAVWPSVLVDLLRDRFEKIGNPVHTVLDDTGKDYVIMDDRNLFWMHSFVAVGDGDPRRLLSQQLKRLNYLKRELVEDLRAGEKIFVYKDSQQAADDALLKIMADYVASYGENLLLAVRPSDAENPSGSTRMLMNNVMIGYITKMFPRDGANLDLTAWLQVLEAAYRYKNTGYR